MKTELAKQRHLNNAPIIEAIIDIRINAPSGFNPQIFSSLPDELSKQYPKREDGKLITGSIEIKNNRPIAPLKEKGIQGYRYASEDEKIIAQFRVDGFTLSHLQPYTNWEFIISHAKPLWEYYLSKVSPQSITRVASRYINRLDLPLPIEDFGDYLTSPPYLPDSLPQELINFIIRLIVREEELSANITQTMVESPKRGHNGIIIDVDAYKANESGIREEDILPTLEKLRELKNRIFFGVITEKTARLFE